MQPPLSVIVCQIHAPTHTDCDVRARAYFLVVGFWPITVGAALTISLSIFSGPSMAFDQRRKLSLSTRGQKTIQQNITLTGRTPTSQASPSSRGWGRDFWLLSGVGEVHCIWINSALTIGVFDSCVQSPMLHRWCMHAASFLWA